MPGACGEPPPGTGDDDVRGRVPGTTRVASGKGACRKDTVRNLLGISGRTPEKEVRAHRPPVTEPTEEQRRDHLDSARFGRISHSRH